MRFCNKVKIADDKKGAVLKVEIFSIKGGLFYVK